MPGLPQQLKKHLGFGYQVLVHKYGFDDFNQLVFVRGCQRLAKWCFLVGDVKIVDNGMVNGSGRLITFMSAVTRKLQSGYLYHYAFAMIIGLLAILIWLVF